MSNERTPLFWAFCVFYLSLHWYLPQTQDAQSKGVFVMSVKLMSAIFETEFRDLVDAEGNTTKAATAKLVLLALADHANDEGESAYPSVDRLAKKTALSSQTIRNTFDALRHNGIVMLEGTSKYMTNNYTINTNSFPRLQGNQDAFPPLNLFDPSNGYLNPSNQSLEPLNPLDPNHHITINNTSPEKPAFDEELADIGWTIHAGKKVTKKQLYKRAEASAFDEGIEVELKRLRLNWIAFDEKAKETFRRFVRELPKGQTLNQFVTWWLQDEWRAANPPWTLAVIMQRWLQAFTNQTDETRGNYTTDSNGVPETY